MRKVPASKAARPPKDQKTFFIEARYSRPSGTIHRLMGSAANARTKVSIKRSASSYVAVLTRTAFGITSSDPLQAQDHAANSRKRKPRPMGEGRGEFDPTG